MEIAQLKKMLHTYTLNQCPCQVSTSYTLWFLRYGPVKLAFFLLPVCPPIQNGMGENNTRTVLKVCGVKMCNIISIIKIVHDLLQLLSFMTILKPKYLKHSLSATILKWDIASILTTLSYEPDYESLSEEPEKIFF